MRKIALGYISLMVSLGACSAGTGGTGTTDSATSTTMDTGHTTSALDTGIATTDTGVTTTPATDTGVATDTGQTTTPPTDTGVATDTGTTTTPPTDTGADTGVVDTGHDTGVGDTGVVDTGHDTGVADTGVVDTGHDTGVADTGVADTGTADTGSNACNTTTMPTSGGTTSNSTNASGTIGSQNWGIWANQSGGSATFYPTAWSSTWNLGSGADFLPRLGLAFNGTAYSSLGTITAQFNESYKVTTNPSYSTIGVYGWSESNPCVEFYIVEDSLTGQMPSYMGTPLSTQPTIDGGTYKLYNINTTGTAGANACSGSVSSWKQYWSVRSAPRKCGQISVSQHFAVWAQNGMTLGNMLQATIFVEVGGGVGSINFPVSSMTMN